MVNSTNEIPKGYVAVKGSELKISQSTKYLGPADNSENFNIIIMLRRRTDGPRFPDFEYFGKTPPRQRPNYTQEEFASKYGAHPEDVAMVQKFVENAGLKIEETQLASRTIKVSGTVTKMNKAFAISLGKYEQHITSPNPKEEPRIYIYRGREGQYYVPSELGSIVIAVLGLDNRSVSKRAGMGDPTSTNPISMQTLRQLYNFPQNMATNQVIGIASLGNKGYFTEDMDQYFGSNKPLITPISVNSGPLNYSAVLYTSQLSPKGTDIYYFNSFMHYFSSSSPGEPIYPSTGSGITDYSEGIRSIDFTTNTVRVGSAISLGNYGKNFGFTQDVQMGTPIYFNPDPETTQDIQIAATAAPGASINVYFSYDSEMGWIEMLMQVAHPAAGDTPCTTFSSSWIYNENDDPTIPNANISSAEMDAMSSQIQDAAMFGVTVCIASGDYGTAYGYSDGIAHVSYPSSDPWVLAVGGTTVGNISGNTFTEYLWNDIFFGTRPGATGGGISAYFPLPSYQNNANVPKSLNSGGFVGRGVPDVAGDASPNSAYSGLVLGGSPSTGNGTSASTPLWAGLIAVINAALNQQLGFINPYIYQFGKPPFNPINYTDPQAPTNNQLPGYTSPGYPAGPLWDACTGWGSPNGIALLNAFQALTTPSVYINGGYQSADIILLDLSTTPPTPIPVGGLPDTPWDTILKANTAYGFQAVIHNTTGTAANNVQVSFWTFPGGLGTVGTHLADVANVSVSPFGSTTVTSPVHFTTGVEGHLCAAVSLYNPTMGSNCQTNAAANYKLIPDPGQPGTRGCSAWRNTSYTGISANQFSFTVSTGIVPGQLKQPILITVEPIYIPHNWQQLAPVKAVIDTLNFTSAQSRIPIYLLPSLKYLFEPAKIRTKISKPRGGTMEEKEPGTWELFLHEKSGELSFEISGGLPENHKVGDILLVNVSAHYPETDGMKARTVEFLEFVYLKEKPRKQ